MERKVLALVSAVLVLGLLSDASAEEILLPGNAPGGSSWNDAAVWGGNEVVPENIYNTNGYSLRTADSVSEPAYMDTFNGGQLIVGPGAGGGTGYVMVKSSAGDTPININANYLFDGGQIHVGNDGVFNFGGTITMTENGMEIRQRGRGGFTRQLHFVVPITGSGPIDVFCDEGGGELHGDVYLDSANAYSGLWSLGVGGNQEMNTFFTAPGSVGNNADMLIGVNGVVDIDYDVAFSTGTLAIQSGGLLILDQDHTFAGITLAGNNLAVGAYDYAALDAMGYGALVTNDGGSLTVAGAHPTVGFNSGSSSGLETVTPAELTVILSSAEAGQTYTVDYAATGGTATGGGVDYTVEPGTLTFNPGETSKTISIDIVDDGLVEEHETIVVELSNPTGPDVGLGINEHTYTILDPRPTVAFDADSTSETEDAGTIEIPVSLSFASTLTVTVDYAVTGGTATGGGVDYILEPGTLTFEPGETSKTISVELVDDGVFEAPETVVITLSNPTNAELGAITEHTLEICTPLAELTALVWGTDIVGANANTQYPTGGAWGSYNTVNGQGMVSADEHGAWYAPGDGVPEHSWKADGAEGMWIEWYFARGYRIAEMWVWNGSYTGRPAGGSIKGCTIEYYDGSAWQTMFDGNLTCWDGSNPYPRTDVINFGRVTAEKVRLNVSSTYGSPDAVLSEVRFYVSEPPSVAFRSSYSDAFETESPAVLDVDLLFLKEEGQTYTVDYAVTGGTAAPAEDYILAPGTLTFNPGETSQTISIDIIDDDLDEDDETIVVGLSNPTSTGAELFLGEPNEHTYTILDTRPEVSFEMDSSIGRENVTPVDITVSLSFASDKPITVDYEVTGGTATAGVDYLIATGGPACWNSATQCHGDTDATGDVKGSDFLALKDSWFKCDPDPNYNACADFDRDGCVKGSDFLILKNNWYQTVEANCPLESGATLEFAPGETSKTISVELVDDGVVEDEETIVITLSNPANATLGSITEYTFTLVDAGALYLKVDLALPQWGTDVPWPGTAKEGWWPWVAGRWADMYAHDYVWEHDGQLPGGIDGTGVHAMLSMGYEGQAGLHAKDLCRCNLAGDCPPSGFIQGEPIANTWLYAVDWAGPQGGDIVLVFTDLPPGQYKLKSYHNWWEPGPGQGSRNCMRCEKTQPPMPSITANPLPVNTGDGCKPPGKDNYRGLCVCGTGTGVTAIQNAYDVPVTHVYADADVATSTITFETDGSEVLIIYEAPDWGYPDCARGGREGGRGILNAFELKSIAAPQ